MFPSENPTNTKAWSKLKAHYNIIKDQHLTEFFKDDQRINELAKTWQDFYVDFSKNHISAETLTLFNELIDEVKLEEAKIAYFSGEQINKTEGRAVLHTALRDFSEGDIFVDGTNIKDEIKQVKSKIEAFTTEVINGTYKGFTSKSIQTIINIGIGGSDLGPAMVTEALSYYRNHLDVRFVSNVDGDHVQEVIKDLDPETTLFVIVSKSFSTQETLSNATTIRQWFLNHLPQEAVAKHFIAVSSNVSKVEEFGIDAKNIFPMWNWVGGRFSLWSAVGISICLAIGYNNYNSLLKGAYEMDRHFKKTPFKDNLPTIAACLSVWYNNFFDAETEAIITYTQYLNQFATYLQQAIMESNGKYVDRNGNKVNYQTGNIVWGEPGTNSQHAFFQLIHQGTKLIPADFIGFVESLHGDDNHHNKLNSNFIAQTEALMVGRSKEQLNDNVDLLPFKVFEGNKPTTTIFIRKLNPESLGKLIAFYEHKIFVQGVIWNIYSYDQFGVELGKILANKILEDIALDEISDHDASTSALIQMVKSK